VKNPHDGRFKDLAEGHPELFLRLLGLWDPGMQEANPIDLLRELHLDPVLIDHAYVIGTGPDRRIFHFEAFTQWSAERAGTLALYRFLLRRKYKVPVSSFLVWMAEKYMPKTLPEHVRFEDGDGMVLWEIDPAIAFEPGCEPLLPWVPLLCAGIELVEKATDRIVEMAANPALVPGGCPAAEVLAINLSWLASLRYDKVVRVDLLERIQRRMFLTAELFKGTDLYEEAFADGNVAGKAEGKREALARVINRLFPSVSTEGLSTISSPAVLDNLLDTVTAATDATAVQAALNRALQRT
jgi:hypothetical protein